MWLDEKKAKIKNISNLVNIDSVSGMSLYIFVCEIAIWYKCVQVFQ